MGCLAALSLWALEVPSFKSRQLSPRPWGPDPLSLDLTAQRVGTAPLQRNGPWGLDAEGQIGEGLWGHTTGRVAGRRRPAMGLGACLTGFIPGGSAATVGPSRRLQGHREPCGGQQPGWSQCRHGWVPLQFSALQVSNSVRGLHLQREQDRAWDGKTACKRLPAHPCRVHTPPSLHSLQGAPQLEAPSSPQNEELQSAWEVQRPCQRPLPC